MKFSVMHPTARVELRYEHFWGIAHASAYNGCDNPKDVQYIVVVHESRLNMFWTQARGIADRFAWWGQFTVVVNHGRDCLIDQCNAGYAAVSGEIFVGNQDDMRFPNHWDTEIARMIPDTSQLVAVHAKTDGSRQDLLTVPTIATKVLCDEIGPLSPEYDGMFSDDEWSFKVRQIARVIPSNLYFEHLHPAFGKSEVDEIHSQENREEAYRIGKSTLERRRAMGFPRVEGIPGWPPAPSGRNADTAKADSPVTAALGENAHASSFPRKAARAVAEFFSSPSRPDAETMPRPNRRVIACLPNEDHQWISALLRLQSRALERRIELTNILCYTSAPDITRMAITDDLLKTFQGDRNSPYALWIDDDNLMLPDQFDRMVSFLDNNPRADVVAGWCWIRRGDSWATSVGKFDLDQHVTFLTLDDFFRDNPEGNPIHVPQFASGFPCVMMRREVLERLGSRAFLHIPREDCQYGRLGEDFSFFWRAFEAGMRCYVDPMCKVGHIKSQLQEPDLILPPGMTEFPPAIEAMRRASKGERVEVPASEEERVMT